MPEKPIKDAKDVSYYGSHLNDWKNAHPGQWFMGAYDMVSQTVLLLPAEIQWKQSIADNTDQRGVNRYASGARKGADFPPVQWESVKAHGDVPGDLAWQHEGPAGVTLHAKICLRYKSKPDNCVGFSLIKLDREGVFAQFKGSSKSLNLSHGGVSPDVSFAQKTVWTRNEESSKKRFEELTTKSQQGKPLTPVEQRQLKRYTPGTRPERFQGTPQLPENFRVLLLQFFNDSWGIKHVASSYE